MERCWRRHDCAPRRRLVRRAGAMLGVERATTRRLWCRGETEAIDRSNPSANFVTLEHSMLGDARLCWAEATIPETLMPPTLTLLQTPSFPLILEPHHQDHSLTRSLSRFHDMTSPSFHCRRHEQRNPDAPKAATTKCRRILISRPDPCLLYQ